MTLATGQVRVLVVEDDDATRELLEEILREEGYETAGAADGRQALILMRRWRPDLIVLDLVMPKMDGWFFRAQQRQIEAIRDIPVIVMSARRPPWREEDLLDPAAYLPKPFELRDFTSLVRASLGTPAEAAHSA
jgi:CheY-like chemotaxis protein